MCQWTTSTFENSFGYTALDMSAWREMMEKIDWLKKQTNKTKKTTTAAITSRLRLGRSEVLRSLRHYQRAQNQRQHTTDHLEERGVARGSARRSSLKVRERAIVSQTNTGTVSKATLGKLLRDGVERIIMGFSERTGTILNWTELNWTPCTMRSRDKCFRLTLTFHNNHFVDQMDPDS